MLVHVVSRATNSSRLIWMTTPRKISIMGSTGSIGRSAIDVIQFANTESQIPKFEVDVVAAGSDVALLARQATLVNANLAVVADEAKFAELRDLLGGTGIDCAAGEPAITEAARRPCDRLLAAIVGSAGLASTLAAAEQGTDIAIANKESIVCAGLVILAAAKKSGSKILPVDSEHNAIFQVLQRKEDVERLTITASGGPFFSRTRNECESVTPDEAKAHPNWDMGIKNSIDSATLMNKALEFIEAAYLFEMSPDDIDVVIHPQSIVHGMAHYRDGSVLAQLGMPDMKTPIAHALAWPERIGTDVKRLDLTELRSLDFFPVDDEKNSAISLAKQALNLGAGGPTVLNCANEAAVSAFIAGECGFLDIDWVVKEALTRFSNGEFGNAGYGSLTDILELDRRGRELATTLIRQR